MYKIIKQSLSSHSAFRSQILLNNLNNNNNHFIKAFYSTFNFKDNTSIDKQNLKKLIESNEKNYVLIDVRNPVEVETTSLIPTAIHIPLGILPAALSMSDEEYEEFYDRKKFKINGKRSEAAADFARGMGYRSVINYPGSYEDWVSN
ncbi:hypothetical protein DICPUDRAFT_148009 [Dictyostelium purpureum]|uniref:Rhodanese domain-containing protein n=1 Tax=Dictyostelium purpureum TaxID=5786 RepID=F0ZA06_DICPU|nr:uncharacterized protein DICPUDRAFT_148009 [Dictyostelium purpureum]EGC39208.1 hypothetical protein DICPUDRAFT_148009 [Dictyostelium purpureum]|eukprot:XP_003284235.1 hypothetical protein DICPUDRAFT_148009 [Dictyostelium purpureum]